MRSAILFVGLAAVCGCGKKDAAGAGKDGAPGAVEFETKDLDSISDAYRDDPGAADAKYKGKVGRVPFTGTFEREDGKTVARFVRAPMGQIRSAHQRDLLFRFTSEADASKLDRRKGYYLIGRCEGLEGNVILFTGCRADGEYPPPVR
jgi:hypothetical protein